MKEKVTVVNVYEFDRNHTFKDENGKRKANPKKKMLNQSSDIKKVKLYEVLLPGEIEKLIVDQQANNMKKDIN